MKRLFNFGRDIMERFTSSKRKKVGEVDYFERLPDELVVEIFEKVCEAKCLCMCYLVSRRFATLVLQTHTVSFKYPLPPSLQNHPLVVISMVDKFLMKFVSIQSLHVQVIFGETEIPLDGCIVKWNSVGFFKSFIFLAVDNNPVLDYKIFSLHTIDQYTRTRYWVVITMIVRAFPNLKEAVVTDSLNIGRYSVGETDLDRMRMPNLTAFTPVFKKLWTRLGVKLPLSGVVMEKALLLIIKDQAIDIDDVSIAENAFEEKQFCEAAMEILKPLGKTK